MSRARLGRFLLAFVLAAGCAGGEEPKPEGETAPAEEGSAAAPTQAESGFPAIPEIPADEGPKSLGAKIKKYAGLSGWFKSRYYRDFEVNGREDNTDELRQDLRVISEFKPLDDVFLKVSADARIDYARDEKNGVFDEEKRLKLWELYGKFSLGPVDLTLGRQVIRWGKSDELNPTDNFTPENLSELVNYDRAERKEPVWMVRGQYYFLQDFTYEFTWQPWFTRNFGATKESDWFFPPLRRAQEAGLRLRPNPPEEILDNNVFANRLLFHGENTNFDAGITYAYHFNQTPSFHFQFPDLVFRHDRQHSVGGEFEMTVGAYGIRGEAVYTTDEAYATEKLLDRDGITHRDQTTFVLGMDHTFENDIYINLQYSGRYIWHFSNDIKVERYEDQILWSVSRKFMRDDLELAFAGRYAFYPSDYFLNPTVEYRVNDHATAKLWIGIYGGSGEGIFNQFNHNDQIGFEIKLSF